MTNKLVTVLIPNYKTLDITKICLRLIRRHTNLNQVEVIVIDNDSADASTAYLRTIPWITLIERETIPNESGVMAHARALDLALKQVSTPYVLSIHTDTFVKSDAWIDVLLAPFKENENIAGVGSWKLESKTAIQKLGYRIENMWKYVLFKTFGYKGYNANRLNKDAHYLRSHCAMYKTEVIKSLNTHFGDGETTAGKVMHKKIVNAGYEMIFLTPEYLGEYIDHINHATAIFNPRPDNRRKLLTKGNKRIKKIFRGIDAMRILEDSSLDQ